MVSHTSAGTLAGVVDEAVLVARTALDKKVEVALTNSGNKLTDIKIRVGIFGDEQLSLSILEKIKSGL